MVAVLAMVVTPICKCQYGESEDRQQGFLLSLLSLLLLIPGQGW